MTILTGANVISRAAGLLLDAGNTRWTPSELLEALNDGRRETAILRPDLYAVVTTIALVAGATQTLPAGSSRLLDVVGASITEREMLDALDPAWRSGAQGATVHFMYDERVPRQFLVYPPAVGGASLQIEHSPTPTDLPDASAALTEEGPYAVALIDYLLYRALIKDADYAGNDARAQAHYQRFVSQVTGGVQAIAATTPNSVNAGGVPTRGLGG